MHLIQSALLKGNEQIEVKSLDQTKGYAELTIREDFGSGVSFYTNNDFLAELQDTIYRHLHTQGYYDHPDEQRILNAEHDGIE